MKLIEVMVAALCCVLIFPGTAGCFFSAMKTIDRAYLRECQTDREKFISGRFQTACGDDSLAAWKRECTVLYHLDEIDYEINERTDNSGEKLIICRGWWKTERGVIHISKMKEK